MVSGAEQVKRNYEDLIGAIVQQAVIDYRSACRHLNDNDEGTRFKAENTIKEVELFLVGDYLPALSGVDGRYILNRIRKEAA